MLPSHVFTQTMESTRHEIFLYLVILHLARLTSCVEVSSYTSCNKRVFSSDSFVCVCSEDYCDAFNNQQAKPLANDNFAVYTSSKDGDRFALEIGEISPHAMQEDGVLLQVDETTKYQEIIGFGGAFTDAATINIKNLSNVLQDHLINSYYSPDGIEYNIGRIPMASCDFSTRIYTYDDVPGDFSLTNFNLAKEDLNFKIPVIKTALSRSKREVKLFGSPWSAPGWMKTSNSTVGGQLKGKAGNNYHKTWADYFVKFLGAYEKNGLKLWGVTVENEPFAGYVPNYKFQCMGFTGSTERDFVKTDLGPALQEAGYGDVKLMIFDDNRLTLPGFTDTVLSDKDAAKYVSGVGVHWYEDFLPAFFLSKLHDKHPEYFILGTEACTGYSFLETRGPVLGSWDRGEQYSQSIIEDLTNWVAGWTDWNLALNMEGGPNWVKNFVDSPIIVDSERKVFYKQPMYFHMGHFSKFVPPGSFRIEIKSSSNPFRFLHDILFGGLEYIAFLLPDGSKSAVVVNRSKDDIKITLNIGRGYINGKVKASSIQTYLWL